MNRETLAKANKEEIVRIADSFGYKEASPHYCQIMVAKREKVDRLIPKRSAHPKVSPSRSAAEGARRDAHKKERLFRVLWVCGLSKPTGNVASKQRIIGGVLGVNVILATNKALKT